MGHPTTQRRSAGAAVGFLVIMEFGSGILQGWFSPLYTSLGDSFGVSAASLNWISAAYLLATVLVVPLLSKLGDIYGHKRILMIATAIVAVASFAVAFAPNYAVFLAARAIQAPLAVFLPLEFAIVHQRDSENAGRSIGRLVGALTLGAAVGGLLSGAVLDATSSLTVTLLVPAVFMSLCVLGVALFVAETTLRSKQKVDYLGALLLGAGLVALLGGVSNMASWAPALSMGAVLLGALLLAGWVFSAKRSDHPLIDLRMLASGGIGLPIIVAFLFGAQMFGAQTPISLYLRTDAQSAGFGFSAGATTAGLVLSIFAVASFFGATFSDRLARKVGGHHAVMIGGLLSAIGYVLMILAPGTLAVFTCWLLLVGFGAGLVIGALPTIVVTRADKDSVGIASGLYNTARTAAGAVAGALFALLMAAFASRSADGANVSSALSYHSVWWICAALCVAFAILARSMRQPATGATSSTEASPVTESAK